MKFGVREIDNFVDKSVNKYNEMTSGEYGFINKIIIWLVIIILFILIITFLVVGPIGNFIIMWQKSLEKTNFMFQDSRDINIYVVLSFILGAIEVAIIALTIIAGAGVFFMGF